MTTNQGMESYFLKITSYTYSLPNRKSNKLSLPIFKNNLQLPLLKEITFHYFPVTFLKSI